MVLSMLVGHVGIGKVLLCIIVFECCGRHTQAMRKVLGCLGICSQSSLGSGLGRRGLGPKSGSKYWRRMAAMD